MPSLVAAAVATTDATAPAPSALWPPPSSRALSEPSRHCFHGPLLETGHGSSFQAARCCEGVSCLDPGLASSKGTQQGHFAVLTYGPGLVSQGRLGCWALGSEALRTFLSLPEGQGEAQRARS